MSNHAESSVSDSACAVIMAAAGVAISTLPLNKAVKHMEKLVAATRLGPDIASLLRGDDKEALLKAWKGSAVQLKDNAWGIVLANEEAISVEGGGARVRIFDGGQLTGRGHFRDAAWLKTNAIAVYPGALALEGGRGERAAFLDSGSPAELQVAAADEGGTEYVAGIVRADGTQQMGELGSLLISLNATSVPAEAAAEQPAAREQFLRLDDLGGGRSIDWQQALEVQRDWAAMGLTADAFSMQLPLGTLAQAIAVARGEPRGAAALAARLRQASDAELAEMAGALRAGLQDLDGIAGGRASYVAEVERWLAAQGAAAAQWPAGAGAALATDAVLQARDRAARAEQAEAARVAAETARKRRREREAREIAGGESGDEATGPEVADDGGRRRRAPRPASSGAGATPAPRGRDGRDGARESGRGRGVRALGGESDDEVEAAESMDSGSGHGSDGDGEDDDGDEERIGGGGGDGGGGGGGGGGGDAGGGGGEPAGVLGDLVPRSHRGAGAQTARQVLHNIARQGMHGAGDTESRLQDLRKMLADAERRELPPLSVVPHKSEAAAVDVKANVERLLQAATELVLPSLDFLSQHFELSQMKGVRNTVQFGSRYFQFVRTQALTYTLDAAGRERWRGGDASPAV